MKIYKYPIPRRSAKFSVMLPAESRFLRVGFQGEGLFFWAEVIPENSPKEVKFQLFGTGQEIPDSAKYMATYDDGPFVMHLYEIK